MSQHNIIIIIQPCRGILDKKIFIRNLSSNGDCFCEIIDYMNKVNVSFRETLPPDIMKIVIELLNRKKVVVPSKVIQNWKGLIATGQLASPNNLQYFNGSKS